MKRSVVLALLVLIAVIACVSAVPVQARDEIKLTTIVPDQTTVLAKKGLVGRGYLASYLGGSTGIVSDDALCVEGNVGIGTTTPSEKLEVNGGVKIGNTAATNAGTIRWTGTAFEGYNGTSWVSLGVGSGVIAYSNNGLSGTFSITQSGKYVVIAKAHKYFGDTNAVANLLIDGTLVDKNAVGDYVQAGGHGGAPDEATFIAIVNLNSGTHSYSIQNVTDDPEFVLFKSF